MYVLLIPLTLPHNYLFSFYCNSSSPFYTIPTNFSKQKGRHHNPNLNPSLIPSQPCTSRWQPGNSRHIHRPNLHLRPPLNRLPIRPLRPVPNPLPPPTRLLLPHRIPATAIQPHPPHNVFPPNLPPPLCPPPVPRLPLPRHTHPPLRSAILPPNHSARGRRLRRLLRARPHHHLRRVGRGELRNELGCCCHVSRSGGRGLGCGLLCLL